MILNVNIYKKKLGSFVQKNTLNGQSQEQFHKHNR